MDLRDRTIAEIRLEYRLHILKMPPDKESLEFAIWYEQHGYLRSWMLIKSERAEERPEPKPDWV